MQELIVVQKQDLKEISILEDGILKEHYKEKEDKKRLEGNIYIGKVTDVLIGMQAAFVDIGAEKNAFLHIRDILPKKSNITGNKEEELENYKIKDYIKPNQKVLVQVKKDSNNIKGARVSTNIQIAGKFVVILPENDFITVSQKIENEEERNRLISIVESVKNDKKIGIIIRTAAEGKEESKIKKDIENTLKELENIQKEFLNSDDKVPKIIKKNDTILEKILLDIADNKLEKIYANNKELQKEIEQILKRLQEDVTIKVELVEEGLENKYDLNSQIEKISNRKIWLKCGGFITIDKTEALTAIDVNSGKFTGKENIEKTALKVNKEASIEIAKQLRLRDIGGIIIIDYIDMNEETSREEIIELLKENLKNDRAKTQVMEFTKLSLLEITRKHMFSEE